jgi:ankyrin repeat protein
MDMSTEQKVLEKLEPLIDSDIRPEFVENIARPTCLAKPTKVERLRDVLEERFCFGEFGIAVGVLGALTISRGIYRLELAAVVVVSAFIVARMLTAVMGKRVTSLGGGVLAGMLGTLMAIFLCNLISFFRHGLSWADWYHPVEWMKVSLLFQPFRFGELLVFGGGLAALVTFVARIRLEHKPWLSGELHSHQGRKRWIGLFFLLGTFVIASLLASPGSEERRTPGSRSYPLAYGIEQALQQDDMESLLRFRTFYPDALNWYNFRNKVTRSVSSLEMARYVVEQGGDFTGSKGYDNALERAVEAHNDPLMEFLLEHGSDPNQGETLPLVTAVEHQRMYAIQVLLDHGADPAKQERGGRSALDTAKQMNKLDILHALKDARK